MTDLIKGALKRPGGFDITERGVALCGFSRGDAIADVGCGSGRTIGYLEARHGFRMTGIDVNPSFGGMANIITADAKKLPFADSSLDGLIFECSMSKMEPPDAVLGECARVLKPGGRLMASDVYARGEAAVLSGLLGRVERKEQILRRAGAFGFEAEHFEDCSGELTAMWAQMVLENGEDALCGGVGADMAALRRIRCGYYLAVFRKPAAAVSRVDAWTGAVMGLGAAPEYESVRLRQLQKIKETIAYAATEGFYERLLEGVDPDAINGFADFERLPFTTASDLLREPSSFMRVSPNDVKRIVTQRSSGTSGEAKRVFYTEGDILRTEDFFAYALSEHIRSGQKAVIFLSNDTPDGVGDILRRAFHRIGVEAEIFGSIMDAQKAAEAAAGCSLMIGTPAELLRLCRTAPGLSPRHVLLTADYIPESIVSALKREWGCGVIRHFGMTETCFGCAVDCTCESGQHIRHADFYVELVCPENGEPVPFGEAGEIVITSLQSEALPLIRYRTGDYASLSGGACRCGGTLPRLNRVLGRLDNLKARLNIHALDELMFSFEGLSGYEAELNDGELVIYADYAGYSGGVDAQVIEEAFGVRVKVIAGIPKRKPPGAKRKLAVT